MHKREMKSLKKMLPLLLVAVLWIDGTLGTVYASGLASQEMSAADAEQTAKVGEAGLPEGVESAGEEALMPDSEGKPAEEDEKERPEGEESGEIMPGKEDDSDEERSQDLKGEETTLEEGDNSDEESLWDPDEAEKPKEEGTPVSGEELDREGMDALAEGGTGIVSEGATVSENTAEQAETIKTDEKGCMLGEPPLRAEEVGGYAAYSYNGISSMEEGNQGIRRQTPAVSEIIDRYRTYPWRLGEADSFSERPSTGSPYKAGHLSGKSLENALNLLNFIRYVAGIPADVTLNEDYTQMTQAGALLNCVNGKLSHEPARPGGFTEEYNELYEKGRKGCASSNIAVGYGNISKALLNGWMYDGDSSNIDRMGHRRWVLNPAMTQTGFGAVGSYSAMYAFGREGAEISDFVAWPAQNMPIELMNGSGTPWTLSLGSDYEKASFQEVSVTLQDISNNKSWTFSGTRANGVFKVNIEYYGMPNCIIFRPNNIGYDKNSQFQVEVSGIRDKNGNAATISYHVDFFSLQDTPAEVKEVVLNKEKLHLLLKDQDGKAQEEVLLATVAPSKAADKTLTWKSTDDTVATVDENGRVVAVGVGTAEISATAVNGVQDVCTVKVSDYSLQSEAAGFSFDEETKTYRLEFDLTMNAEPGKLVVMDGNPLAAGGAATDRIDWISENEEIAEVGTNGTVTPGTVGETVIWAVVDNGLAVLACEVTVEDSRPPQMEMWKKECALTIKKDATGNLQRESSQLQVFFTPTDSKWVNRGRNYIKWVSDNPMTAAFMTVREDGIQSTVAETVSGNTVLVTAVGAGETRISAVLVNSEGKPVTDSDGKEAEVSCRVTVREEPSLADKDIPRPVVLVNEKTTLWEVALPEGWSWKEPETTLAQFTGGKTKKFTALYKPKGAGETILPAERLLEVCFLTVESLSMEMKLGDGKEQEDSVLTKGQELIIYVNHEAGDLLKQLDENENYKDNEYYKAQRDDILNIISKNLIWSSSRPDVVSVEPMKGGVTLTSENAGSAKLMAKSAGSATVKASLNLGSKTFNASVKLTVKEAGGTLTIKGVENFTCVGEADSGTGQTVEKYTGLLSAFQSGTANQSNSKITMTLPGATKVTAKSSNAKVVAVKSSAAEGGEFVVFLTVKAAGTAELTLTGNDVAKTSRTLRLVVGNAEPGLSDESVTLNVLKATGAKISLYPAKGPDGIAYGITDVTMAADEKSAKFTLTKGAAADSYLMQAKNGTSTGTYKVKILATAGGVVYDLPLTVRVVSKKPSYKAKQMRKLNLFYKETKSPLRIDTEEKVTSVILNGCADYCVEKDEYSGCYYVSAKNATTGSVKKGTLQISFEGWTEPFTTSFTVGVEKKAPELILDTSRVVLYPKAGVEEAVIGIKMPTYISWESLKVEMQTGAQGNYETKKENQASHTFTLKGSNLNRAESVKARITLRNDTAWMETLTCNLNIIVSMGQPAITLENKTLQLNSDVAYRGYDAVSTAVRWKKCGILTAEQGVRVSVYCDPKDAKAKSLVSSGQVVFSVKDARVFARLNNKAVESGTYKYIVQAAKNGQIWKTPLTLKVVNTAPDKAVKMTAKGSIDVLNRDDSFMTLTPSLKAVNGEFVILEGREVKLTGRDAHLFRASWSEDGKTIELRAKRKETLIVKYQYTVTPLLTLRNVCGMTEEITAPAVKFKVKQGSVKVSASPKTALMYSGTYNSVEIDMNAALKGADAPEIERAVLTGNTDAFTFVYNKEGKGTLTMNDTGRAVKGKTYSLQFKVSFAEQADNVKPITVKVTVKVK